MNLERAIQQCVDIASIIISDTEAVPPATMASSFTVLAENRIIDNTLAERLSKAVGFRNIAVHEYNKRDWVIVYSIITKDIEDFRKFTSSVLSYMKA